MTSPERPEELAAAVQTQMAHSRAHGCPEAEVLPVALALVFKGWMSRDTAKRSNEAHRAVDRHNRATAERDRDAARRERDAARQEAAGRCAQLIRDRIWRLTGKYRQEGAAAAADWLIGGAMPTSPPGTAAWTCTSAPADVPGSGPCAEVVRLRGLVYEHAQGWHWKAGAPSGERCACEGCELIRALDDVETQPDAAPVEAV